MANIPEELATKIEKQADLREKELIVKTERVEREYERIKANQDVYNNIRNFDPANYDFETNQERLVKKIYGNIRNNRDILKQALTFVNIGLTDAVPFARGSLYLIGGVSGHGKSTTAANVSFPLWKEGKKVLVLSNEESDENVVARIACLDLQVDFNAWRNDTLNHVQRSLVDRKLIEVLEKVTVIGTDTPGLTNTLEGIQMVLEKYKNSDYSCILIDFFQNIGASTKNPTMERTPILMAFKAFITTYVVQAKMPVVLFAQLMPLPQDAHDRQFEVRIKWCKGIYEAATTALEIVRIPSQQKTVFVIDKDRFGKAGRSIDCNFKNGRYEFSDPRREVEQKVEEMAAAKVKDV